MNNMVREGQKVQDVNNFILLFCMLLPLFSFSQKAIEGKYSDGFGDWFLFHSNGTFDYRDEAELGTERYGKGHYTLTKDSLFLDFDLTKLKYSGYHIIKSYQTTKDLRDIKISVYDLDKNPLPQSYVHLINGIGKSNGNTDTDGKIQLVTKKRKETEPTYLVVDYNGCTHHIQDILPSLNYEIEVFLTKDFFDEPFERFKAIKNDIWKYKIKKIKDDYIELRGESGLNLRKVKIKYEDDPFERERN